MNLPVTILCMLNLDSDNFDEMRCLAHLQFDYKNNLFSDFVGVKMKILCKNDIKLKEVCKGLEIISFYMVEVMILLRVCSTWNEFDSFWIVLDSVYFVECFCELRWHSM